MRKLTAVLAVVFLSLAVSASAQVGLGGGIFGPTAVPATGGTYTGPVYVPDGAAGTPSIGRSAANSHGFFFTASGFGYGTSAANSLVNVLTAITAQRSITWPDASITVARSDAAQTFTGVQTFSTSIVLTAIAFASLGTPANGTLSYCNDCTIANPCAGAGTGALAKRLAGAWVCN